MAYDKKIHYIVGYAILLCHNFLIGKGHTYMCTENHVCFGRIHGSQLSTYVRTGTYTCTYNVMSQLYHGTYTCTSTIGTWYTIWQYQFCITSKTKKLLEIQQKQLETAIGTNGSTYTCTNITMVPLVSHKRLEIQALRCNGDTIAIVGVVSIEDITVDYS